jgi:hypothetical protein
MIEETKVICSYDGREMVVGSSNAFDYYCMCCEKIVP